MRGIIISLLLPLTPAAASAGGFGVLLTAAPADIAKYVPASAPVPGPPERTDRPTRVRMAIDYSRTPELEEWAENELRPALEKWYPLIAAALPSPGFSPPENVSVTIDPSGGGIAHTADTRVTVFAPWIKSQMGSPKSEAVGSVIHELVHVVQQYGRVHGGAPVPGWLTEGIADHIRWWRFEPPENRRPVRPYHADGAPASYKDGYQTAAAFLEYASNAYDGELMVRLNAAGRTHTYSPALWKSYTGKDLDALWSEFAETLGKQDFR